MDPLLLGALMGLVLIVLIFSRLDIAFAIGIVAILWLVLGDHTMSIAVTRTWGALNKFVLLAIPFFLLAGELMNRGGITETLVQGANLTLGRFRGGLAQANVGGSLLFSGITGAAVADVAALGSIFVPVMADEGYDRDFSAALTAASSLIGPIIPPSIIIVIYGAITDTSIGGLFAAAVIPGILLGGMLMILVAFISYRRDYPKYDADISRREVPRISFHIAIAMTMPAIILFGIVLGIFTPTEAAAIACVYALLVGVGYRTLDTKKIKEALHISIERTVQLYIIIGISGVLSWLLAREQIPTMAVEGIRGMGFGPVGFMLICCALLIFVGTWLDISAATILLAPSLADMAVQMGIHEFHFGIVLVMVLLMGLITPPVGICLFVASSVSNRPVWEISKEIVPFFAFEAITVFIIILFPELTLWVPRYFGLI